MRLLLRDDLVSEGLGDNDGLSDFMEYIDEMERCDGFDFGIKELYIDKGMSRKSLKNLMAKLN